MLSLLLIFLSSIYFVCSERVTLVPDQWVACNTFTPNADTQSATQNYLQCIFELCREYNIYISTCGANGSPKCTGDTYIRLFDSQGKEVTHNDDGFNQYGYGCESVGDDYYHPSFSSCDFCSSVGYEYIVRHFLSIKDVILIVQIVVVKP
jgi:hypothetical protein